MSALITNLPSMKVYVRKEYLMDHQEGHGEFVEGHWVTAKSIPGRAFYFETYRPITALCTINYRLAPLYQSLKHQNRTCPCPICNSGTVWTTVSRLFTNNSLAPWILRSERGMRASNFYGICLHIGQLSHPRRRSRLLNVRNPRGTQVI